MIEKRETLGAVLSRLDENQLVKVGSKDGSSWFFIGQKKVLIGNDLIYDAEIESWLKERLKTARQTLNDKMKQEPTYFNFTKAEIDKFLNGGICDLSIEKYHEYVKHYWKGIMTRAKTVIKREEAIKNQIPLLSRPVVSADESIKGDGIRIIIEGTEEGRFWDKEEADALDKTFCLSRGGEEYEMESEREPEAER